MELQGTHLHSKMDRTLVQGITTMMQQLAIVLSCSKMPGGIVHATIQTSMLSTVVNHAHLLMMMLTFSDGEDSNTPSNFLRWNWDKVRDNIKNVYTWFSNCNLNADRLSDLYFWGGLSKYQLVYMNMYNDECLLSTALCIMYIHAS